MLPISVIDLLFPPICVGCHRELRHGALCPSCGRVLFAVSEQRCPHCETRLARGKLPSSCSTALGVTHLAVATPYGHPLVRAAIDALKYEAITDLAYPLGALLAQTLSVLIDDHESTTPVLIPIPLHTHRLRQRGFNQSALVAREVRKKLLLPLEENVLTRHRPTHQQAKLPRKERAANVHDAFRASITLGDRAASTFILIDDVITTGATIREAARALRRAGAKNVWAAAVARG